jgi:hypothetical protein
MKTGTPSFPSQMMAKRIIEITGVERKVIRRGFTSNRKVEFNPAGIPIKRAITRDRANPSKPLPMVDINDGQKLLREITSTTERRVFSGDGISCSEPAQRLMSFHKMKRSTTEEKLMSRFFVIKFFIGQFSTYD